MSNHDETNEFQGEGPTWVASVVGRWGSHDGPHLILTDDGRLSGTDGCNRLIGRWNSIDGEAEREVTSQRAHVIDFGEVASTMMFCDGVDTWLSALATATVDGDVMHVANSDGAEVGTLARDK